jgi:hypothetical protein
MRTPSLSKLPKGKRIKDFYSDRCRIRKSIIKGLSLAPKLCKDISGPDLWATGSAAMRFNPLDHSQNPTQREDPMEEDEDDGFSGLRFGEMDEDKIDWSVDPPEDPDDEPSERTPRSIISALGYDPLSMDDDGEDDDFPMDEDNLGTDLPLEDEEDEL